MVDKRKSLNLLPEYKACLLAKEMKIRSFSPTAILLTDLKKKLLADPTLEDHLYVLASGKTEEQYLAT